MTLQPIPAGQSSEEVLLAAVVAGTTPDLCSNIWPGIVSEFVHAGGVLALDRFPDFDSLMQDRLPPGLLDQFRAGDGHVYQLPWKTNPALMQYNVRLFREAGFTTAPRTYSDYLEAARRITADLDGDGQFDRWIGYRDIQPIWHQRFFDYYAFYVAASGGKTLFRNGAPRPRHHRLEPGLRLLPEPLRRRLFPPHQVPGQCLRARADRHRVHRPVEHRLAGGKRPTRPRIRLRPAARPRRLRGTALYLRRLQEHRHLLLHPAPGGGLALCKVPGHERGRPAAAGEWPPRFRSGGDLLTDPAFADFFARNPKLVPFAEQAGRTRGVDDVSALPEILDALARQFEAAAVYGVRSPEEATRAGPRTHPPHPRMGFLTKQPRSA
ncbi:MAG: hypothetical protein KatS3mg043_1602 [Rhodothermaceae bacterium]|nr:MAG: hypothetical protein KatS3mg043_1602 [Rhodothermaceae bacterium]